MPDAHQRGTVDLAAVGDQPDLARLFDDALGDAHFAWIEVAQGPVQFDAGDTDDADVDLELLDEIHGGVAHDPLVPVPDDAPGDDDFALRVVGQDGGHVQVVRHDVQVVVLQQCARHFFRRRTDVDEGGTGRRQALGGRLRDLALGLDIDDLAVAVVVVLHGRQHGHPAVIAQDQPLVLQELDVAPDRLAGHVELSGKVLDRGGRLLFQQTQDLALPGVEDGFALHAVLPPIKISELGQAEPLDNERMMLYFVR